MPVVSGKGKRMGGEEKLDIEERHIEIVQSDNQATVEQFWRFPEHTEEFIDHQASYDHDIVRGHRDRTLRLYCSGEDLIERLRLSGQQGQHLTMIAVETTVDKVSSGRNGTVESKTTLIIIETIGDTIHAIRHLEYATSLAVS